MKLLLLILVITGNSVLSQNSLIKNGSFKKKLTSWNYGVHSNENIETLEASFVITDPGKEDKSSLRVRVSNSFPYQGVEKIYLSQDGIKLKKRKTYRVSFYVKSKIKRDQIYVGLGSASSARKFSEMNKFFLGNNEWQKLTYTFSDISINYQKSAEYENLVIYFGFNLRDGDYFIDDINVEQVKK